LKNASIFRERAIEKYIQRKEQHTILQLVSPRVSLFLWVLVLLFFSGVVLIWSVQLPITVSGMGVVIQQNTATKPVKQETIVLLILSPDQLPNLRVGQPVTITAGPANSSFTSSIERVETGVMNPTQVRTQFNLQGTLAQAITGPSAIATVQVAPGTQAMTYLGSQGQAQIQIGSESVLSLLPGFNQITMTNFSGLLATIENFFISLPGFFKTLLKN